MKTIGDFRDKLTVGTTFRMNVPAWGHRSAALLQVSEVQERGIVCNVAMFIPGKSHPNGPTFAPRIINIGHYDLYEWDSVLGYLCFGTDDQKPENNILTKE